MTPRPARRPERERALLGRAARWRPEVAWADLGAGALRAVAARAGVDFATALLYDRLRRSERHGPFIRRIDGLMARASPPPKMTDVLFAVAPGAFYRELPGHGSVHLSPTDLRAKPTAAPPPAGG